MFEKVEGIVGPFDFQLTLLRKKAIGRDFSSFSCLLEEVEELPLLGPRWKSALLGQLDVGL